MSPRDPVPAWIGLGANLGDSVQTVRAAVDALAAAPGITLVRVSPLYQTAPQDADGADYTNAVVQVICLLPAPLLMSSLQEIEQSFGRERAYVNAPRTLDLDLLLYGNATIQSPHLSVPHPRMHQRAFVLVPLADVSPELVSSAALAAVAGQGIRRLG
jgi:2-amino-4-hydroxy-6-hydroxymethyldihydropteridine diphosphokinase